MYALHIANKNYSSWSLRPWALLKEQGIPFEERLAPFGAPDSNAFRSFSPSSLVPVLRDGDTVVWDSLAIAEYVAEHHPGVWPTDRNARAWARSAAAEMHSGFTALRSVCTMNVGIRVRLRETPAPLARNVARIAELWNDGLHRFGGPFLAGSTFGAVDAFYCPVAFRVQSYGLALDENAAAYAARLLALPSMKKWEAAALVEPWRDEAHEEEARAAGTITADLRTTKGAS